MTNFIKPGFGRVRSVILAGIDITQYVQCLRLYETLCKQYLTAHLILMDNNNVINNLGIEGMEPCDMSFDCPPNTDVYDASFGLLQLSGHQSPNNLKTQIYDIDLIGWCYFNDKANLVQESGGQTKPTDLMQKIWGEYLEDGSGLNIPVPAINMLGTEKAKSTIDHKKPFAAIDALRKLAVFPDNSPSVFFRDRHTDNIVPFKYLENNAGSQYSYIQKEVWGATFPDEAQIYAAIIYAEADVDKNFNGEGATGGRASTQSIAKAIGQSQSAFDMFSGWANKIASGSLGGSPNIALTDNNLFKEATAPFTKAADEQQQAAEAKNGQQLKFKVPLQTGLFCTVGKGVTVSLLPPTGNYAAAYNDNPYNGQWLVKDICHEIYTDKREMQATTTMQCIRSLGKAPGD